MSVDRCRSGELAAWLRSWRAGLCSYDDVLSHTTGHDEPHRVVGLPDRRGSGHVDVEQTLGAAALALRDEEPEVALVGAGDPRGLPAPRAGDADGRALVGAALIAGEAVVGRTLALVPTVVGHGSAIGSRAITVRWQAYAVHERRPDPLDVAGAEHELADALRAATTELMRLDVASWRSDLTDALSALRRPTGEPGLPPGFDARSQRLLAQAERLERILLLAAADAPGGAVTGQEARQRQESLAPLATACRRARTAAYNAPVGSLDRHS